MSNRLIQYGFTAGIVSKTLWSQTVLQKYGYGLADCRNYIIEFSGALISRPGLLAARLLPMAVGKNYRLVPFIFAEEDANTYEILFVANKIYFLQQGAYQLESGKTVTKVEDGANYTQFTSNAHGYSVGDLIEFYGTGVPAHNQGQTVVVTQVTTNTFQCQQINKAADLDGWTAATASGVQAFRVYSLSSPYGETDLPDLYFNQARDVVEITSYDFDPKELERQSDGTWTLTNTVFELAISRPQNLTVTLEPSGGVYEELFAVSAVTDQGESLPSEPVRAYGASAEGGATLKWDAISDATKYIIYRSILAARDAAGRLTKAQALGYLGTSYAPLYFSYNQIPDFTKAPRRNINPFARAGLDYFTVTNGGTGYTVNDSAIVTDSGGGTGGEIVLVVDNNSGSVVGIVVLESGHGYVNPVVEITTAAGTGATFTVHTTPSSGNNPAISAIHQQRRIFGSSLNAPMTLWGSNIGSFSTFTRSDIVADDDAYDYALATPTLGALYHIISTRVGMLAFANIGVWQITGSQGGAITPTDVQVDPITVVGSSKLPPLLIDSDVVYAETNNETIRLLQYNHFSRQYGGIDLSILAKDLFKGFFNLSTWSFENRPYRIIWAARNDGQYLTCTVSQEQEVYAWARHDTAGMVEQNITVPESAREVTYSVVRRYLNSRWVYSLEYFADRSKSTNENHCGVDCAVQFGGTQPSASLTFDGTYFVASAATFAAADVGKLILFRSGKAVITSFVSSTKVEVEVINEFVELEIPYFDLFKTVMGGTWTLATLVSSVRLPLNFRPVAVTIYGDGKLFEDVAVAADGTVTFPEELAFGYIGFGFTCEAVTLPPAITGTIIEASRKDIKEVGIRYVDSKGIELGTSSDDTYPIAKLMHERLTEASLLQSRFEDVVVNSDWDEDTLIHIKANGAFPTQVTGIVLDLEVGDDVD